MPLQWRVRAIAFQAVTDEWRYEAAGCSAVGNRRSLASGGLLLGRAPRAEILNRRWIRTVPCPSKGVFVPSPSRR